MYGAYTILINRENRTASDWFNGKDQMLQESKNTSFSAVGHLCDRGGKTTVTLYENVFANVEYPIATCSARDQHHARSPQQHNWRRRPRPGQRSSRLRPRVPSSQRHYGPPDERRRKVCPDQADGPVPELRSDAIRRQWRATPPEPITARHEADDFHQPLGSMSHSPRAKKTYLRA